MPSDDTEVKTADESSIQVAHEMSDTVVSETTGLFDDHITVLHVDDDRSIAETTAEYLEQINDRITVRTATRATDALEIIDSESVDCVVSDYKMIDMDGLELFDEVRQTHPDVPFLLFTGRGNEDVASEAITAGVTDYIQKESGTDQYHVLANQITNSVQHTRSEQLRDLFQATVEHTGHSIYITDADGVIRYANPTFQKITGYSADEAIGQTPRILKSSEHTEQFYEKLWETILDGGIWQDTITNETKDGERYVVNQTIAPIYNDADEIKWFVAINSDITEQKERERRLDAVFNNTYQFTGLLEPDGTVINANDTALEFGGIDKGDILGTPFWDADWWQIDEETPQRVQDAVERAAAGEFVRYEVEIQGEERTAIIDFSIRPVTNEQGDVTLLIPEGRDITERTQQETIHKTLQTTSSDLLKAESQTEICEQAVSAGKTIIDGSVAIVYVYDPESGELYPEAWTSDTGYRIDTLPAIDGGSPTWQTFVEGDVRHFKRGDGGVESVEFDIAAENVLQIPLEKYGVLVLVNTDPKKITEIQRESAETLGANVTTALERMSYEQELRKHEHDLRQRSEELERLNRINTVVRNITVTVVQESQKEDIEQAILKQFINIDPFELAWIGRETLDGLSIEKWDATSDSFSISDGPSFEDTYPAVRAYQTGEIQLSQNLMEANEDEKAAWKEQALREGYASCCSIPLVHSGTVRGVLMLYASQPDVFTEGLQQVLSELGEIIGYALTAVERQYALESESVVTLTFGIHGDTPVFARLAKELECSIEMKKSPKGDASEVTYLLEGINNGELPEVLDFIPEITETKVIELDEDTAVVELSTVGEWFGSTFVSEGGRIVEATADPDSGRIIAQIPLGIDVRTVVESFQTHYPAIELLAKEEVEKPTRTIRGLREQLEEELTEKQLTVIQTAYSAGYFTQPRKSTGEDVAELLEITQPTFNQHLRSAERKLLGLLLEE